MIFDAPTIIAVLMILAALVSTQRPRRGRTWRASYAAVVLAVLHFLFLYQFIGPIGAFTTDGWAAITAAAVAGLATDDDAEAVGVLLAGLGIFQVLLLAGVLNLSSVRP